MFALIPYFAITLLFTVFQRRLIYHPTRSEPLSVIDAGLAADGSKDVAVSTADGLTLHGWLLKTDSPFQAMADSNSGPIDAAAPLVIYFPGNASHRACRINDLRDFTDLGCDVLIVDYRGYAENPGTPTEETMASDALSVWRFAVEELRVDPRRVLLFGESIGGAVAVSLAADLCRRGTPPAALVTNATFDSIPSLSGYHYPMFPFRWLVWDRWPSINRIPDVTCPLLMFHGTEDQIVPLDHGRRLFVAAPDCSVDGCDKCFVEIPGAGHNDIPIRRLHAEVRRLLGFVCSR